MAMRAIIRWLWVAVVSLLFAGSLAVLFSPRVPQWGSLQLPHEDERFQRVKPSETLRQTFVLEYGYVDSLAIWIKPGIRYQNGEAVLVKVSSAGKEQSVSVGLNHVLHDGLLLARFADLFRGKAGREAQIEIQVPAGSAPLDVQFQIDGSKYVDGELWHSSRKVQGDLGFQVHYMRPALGTVGRQILLAVLLFLSGGFVVWAVYRGQPFERIRVGQDGWWVLGVGAVVFCFYGWWLLLWPGMWIGPGDFVKDVAYVSASQQALSQALPPAWSHLTCGGMPLLGNPESNALSLAPFFAFVMTPERALWLLLCLEAAIGSVGVFVLARMWGVSRFGSAVAAIMAVACAAFPYRIVEGFSMIGGAVAFMPWVLVGVWRALEKGDARFATLAGVSLAVMYWRGEVHILTALLLCVGLWLVVAVLRQGRPAFLMALCVAAMFFVAASPKLLAFAEQPQFFAQKYKPYTVRLLQDGLLDDVWLQVHSRFYPVEVRHGRRTEEWANFGTYIGVVPIVLAVIGFFSRRRRIWIVILGAVASFAIAEGTLFDVGLRHIGPLAGLLRLPVRGLALTMIWLGLLAGAGLDEVRGWFPTKRIGGFVTVLVGLAVVVDLLAADTQVFAETLWSRAAVPGRQVSTAILKRHQNVSPGGRFHAASLLADGYILPKLCADLLAEPDFAKDMPDEMPISTVPASVRANGIVLKPLTIQPEYEVMSRFDSAWVSHQASVVAGSKGQMRVVPYDTQVSEIDLGYVFAMQWAFLLLWLWVLVFVVLLGMILF